MRLKRQSTWAQGLQSLSQHPQPELPLKTAAPRTSGNRCRPVTLRTRRVLLPPKPSALTLRMPRCACVRACVRAWVCVCVCAPVFPRVSNCGGGGGEDAIPQMHANEPSSFAVVKDNAPSIPSLTAPSIECFVSAGILTKACRESMQACVIGLYPSSFCVQVF